MITLSKLRAVVPEPTTALEACDICQHIPRFCSRFEKGGDTQHDNIPPQVDKLVKIDDDILRCPTCNRLYVYEHEYEFIYGGSEDTYSYQRVTHQELLRDKHMLQHRVESDELCGALGRPRRKAWWEETQYFDGYCVTPVAVGADERIVYIALPDDAPALPMTLDTVARMVADAPVQGLDDQKRVLDYVDDLDKWTEEHRYRALRIAKFDEIPWREELTDDDRLQIEDLRRASEVRPLQIERVGDRWELRYWVVADQKLICRVVTVSLTGAIKREDAIVGENIPTHPGKTWEWDHKTKRSIPTS